MTVKAYLGERYEYTHENFAFEQLYRLAKDAWGDEEELYSLIGNVTCNGHELDALLIKPDAIVVIDFKNHGGDVVFSENGPWLANGNEVKGGGKTNPFKQIQSNKFAVLDWFKSKLGKIAEKNNLGHTSGLVLFQQEINFDRSQIPGKIASWFNIGDYKSGMNWLRNLASPRISISAHEQEEIVQALNVSSYHLPEAPKTITLSDSTDKESDYTPPHWTGCQQEAIRLFRNLLETKSGQHVLILTGMVSTGKTELTRYFEALAKEKSQTVVFLAPNATLARELHLATGVHFQSIYTHIYNQSTEVRNEAEGIYEYPLRSCEDDPKSIYIVDEAQLLSDAYWQMDDVRFGSGHTLSDFLKFSRVGELSNSRFVILGDSYQIKQGSQFIESHIYAEKGMVVAEKELVEVVLDNAESPVILQSAKLATLIKSKRFNNLDIKGDGKQLVVLPQDNEQRTHHYSMVFTESYPDSVFITFANERAYDVCRWGRKRFLKRPLFLPMPGDFLELKNKITTGTYPDTIDSYPGACFRVESCGEQPIVKSIKLRGRDHETVIRFRELTVSYVKPYHNRADKVLYLEEFLLATKPELESDTYVALLAIARGSIKQNPEYAYLKAEFDLLKESAASSADKQAHKSEIEAAKQRLDKKERELLKLDPFLNAARFRYAYTTTCGQAQGRKWNAALIDASYNGQGRDNEGYFRWLYTAITRARNTVLIDQFDPITPWDKTQVASDGVNITPAVKSLFSLPYPKDQELSIADQTTALPPGFTSTEKSLINLLLFVKQRLADIGFKIVSVKQSAYQEQYTVDNGAGEQAVLILHYNGKFDLSNLRLTDSNSRIGQQALQAVKGQLEFANPRATEIFNLVQKSCMNAGLVIEGGKDSDWNLRLTLANPEQNRAVITVYFDKQGYPGKIEINKATAQSIVEQIHTAFAHQEQGAH